MLFGVEIERLILSRPRPSRGISAGLSRDHRARRWVCFAAAFIAACRCAIASDLSRVPELSQQGKVELATAHDFLEEGLWDDAFDILDRVAEEHDGLLVRVEDSRLYWPVRNFVHFTICRLPLAGRQAYRRRVDRIVQEQYLQAVEERNPRKLRQLSEQFFASSWGDDALLALGDISLQNGEFDAAKSYWERIFPAFKAELGSRITNSEIPNREVRATPEVLLGEYPDSDLSVADVRARLALAAIWQGHGEEAARHLKHLRDAHPDAMGKWGGREVSYVARLTELLNADTPEARRADREWTTYRGNPARCPRPSHVNFARVAWTARLPKPRIVPRSGLFSRPRQAGDGKPPETPFPAYHPVQTRLGERDYVFLSTVQGIYAWDLITGQPAWGTSGEARIYRPPSDQSSKPPRDSGSALHTLTVCGNHLLARTGHASSHRPSNMRSVATLSRIVCLDLSMEGKLAWQLPSSEDEERFADEGWAYEGTPLCDGSLAFVGLRRTASMHELFVEAHDVSSGELVWRQFIGASMPPRGGSSEETVVPRLFTMHGDTLYYHTGVGTVVALDTATGRIRWLRVLPRDEQQEHDSASAAPDHADPCLIADRRLFVAPARMRRVFAIDPDTGRLWWTTPLEDEPCVDLLGVSPGKLIVSGKRLHALDVDTGTLRWSWPIARQSLGYAQGLVSGDKIYWPTSRNEIEVIGVESGRPVEQPFRLEGLGLQSGNLAVMGGAFVITSSDRLNVLCFPRSKP